MSTYQELVDGAVVLLGASGVTGAPAQLVELAKDTIADPAAWKRLNENQYRIYGADLDAAA